MSALPLPPDLAERNSAFSARLPGLQLAIDSTSLGAYKACPRKYYYSIIWGYQKRDLDVHLQFGIWVHEALESYDRKRASGVAHEEALLRVTRETMRKTWNRELGRGWMSDEPSKNRVTLMRTVIWYMDRFGADDSLETVSDQAGKPLVELSFSVDSGARTRQGEQILLCGHGDKIARFADDEFWVDRKTTKRALDARYFASFEPSNQFGLYNAVGKVLFRLPTKGLIVDAMQVGAGFTRFHRKFVMQTEAQANEYLEAFALHARWMEDCAEQREWPMQETACDMYFGCEFRSICSRSPESRQKWLDSEFARRVWNPLEKRGDI